MLRDLQTPDFKFEVASTPEQINLFFDQLVDLHRKRWTADGKPGSFAPRHAQFHRELCMRLAPLGQVVIARLSHREHPIALSYGHRVGAKFDGYQMGVDHNFEVIHSPGAALYLGLLVHLWEDGVVMCDQLTGVNRFKADYAKQQRPLMTLKISQPTLRVTAAAVADFTRRCALKIGRLLTGPSPAATTPQQTPQPNA
jgi:CelD/BcsL family acetyltransferase involved in cellulose biosynthesis